MLVLRIEGSGAGGKKLLGTDANKNEGADIDAIAKSIVLGTDGAMFAEGEREEIMNLTSNSTSYVRRIESITKRFLDTAATRCGDGIRSYALCNHVERNGTSMPLLFFKVSGERHSSKKMIVNSVMLQAAMSWKLTRKQRNKEAGDFPEPSTWDQWMKLLQAKFREMDVWYSLKQDFFGKGEFHAVLEKEYRIQRRKDPNYGTGRYASWIPEDIEELILAAIESSVLDLNGREHLQMVVYYLLGTRFCVRGSTEAHDRVWSELTFEERKEVDGVSRAYAILRIHATVGKGTNPTVRGESLVYVFHHSLHLNLTVIVLL